MSGFDVVGLLLLVGHIKKKIDNKLIYSFRSKYWNKFQ